MDLREINANAESRVVKVEQAVNEAESAGVNDESLRNPTLVKRAVKVILTDYHQDDWPPGPDGFP